MSDFPTYQDDDDALAGEYVLGALGLAERQDVARRIETDRLFADRVAFWEAQFEGFNADYAPITPPKALKSGIEARLFGAPRPWWQRPRVWLGAGFVSAALALGLFIAPPGPQTSPPDFRADLVAEDSPLQFAAAFDQDFGVLQVSGVATESLPEDKSYELWVIPAGAAPVSLGIVSASTKQTLSADLAGLMVEGATLAVTLEGLGGSPTGAPQGPVVALGALKTL